jgi:hypothetical protein
MKGGEGGREEAHARMHRYGNLNNLNLHGPTHHSHTHSTTQ